MLRLCGFAGSNYHNKVKLALIEKQVPFEEVSQYPTQDPAVLAESPMGKLPYLRTPEGTIAESQVILDYLEDAFPAHPLYPSSPFARARNRELIAILELHLELVVRRLYGQAFFGGTAAEDVKVEVERLLIRGLKALGRRTDFAAFVAGDSFTAADCVAIVHLPMVSMATKAVLGRDLLAEGLPAAKDYLKRLSTRESVQRIAADRKAASPEFAAYVARRAKR